MVHRRIVSPRSANGARKELGGLVELRNQVMHPVRNVVLAKDGLERLQKREARIRELITAVEAAIQDGDQWRS